LTDLKRLSREGSDFEVELLRAGRRDAMPAKSGQSILAGLGLAPATAAAAAGGTLALFKAALVVAGAGGVGAFAVWGGHSLLSAPGSRGSETVQHAPATTQNNTSHTREKSAVGSQSSKLEAPKQQQAAKQPAAEAVAKGEAAIESESNRPAATSARTPSGQQVATPAKPPSDRQTTKSNKGDTLGLELLAIDNARSALARGNRALASRLLDDYAAEFPKPRLHTEATVLRIETLAASGNRAAALRLGQAFLRRDPNSPYARRVRSLIGAGATEPSD
jgi:hypothetical protein